MERLKERYEILNNALKSFNESIVYFKELEIVRILPKITLNTNLISDKATIIINSNSASSYK